METMTCGRLDGSGRPTQPSLADAFNALLARSHRRELRPDSITQYEMLWRRVCRQFAPNCPLSSIHTTEVQSWLDSLRATCARDTVRCCRAFLSMLFNVSTQYEIFAGTNPVKRTDPIRSDCVRVRRRLSQEDLAQLLRACHADDTPRGWMWTTFFQVMILSGLRVRETALLRWEDFYWRDGVYRPSHQKRSNGYDILPLTMELESVLAEWSGGREQRGLVFPAVTRCGGRRFCDQARRALKEYAREAALPNPETLGTHALRRTFITQAAEVARGDHVALMQVARHQSFETTRMYMPTVSKAVQEVSAAVAHALGATLGISEMANRCSRSSTGVQASLPGFDAAQCIPAFRSRSFDSARQLRLSFD